MDYTIITQCRGCGGKALESVLNLGEQSLTGVFPKTADTPLAKGPLEIVRCKACTLVQLKHRFNPEEMYGETYGYRSGLNRSMVQHLGNKIAVLQRRANLKSGDTVLDIGCNDGTTLQSYTLEGLHRYGIDPSSGKFLKYYKDPSIKVATEFFTADSFRSLAGDAKCKLVTSIAMFYDLDDPTTFAKDIASVLAPDGIWHTEQSYLPTMLDTNSFDTICHEHTLYYSLKSVEAILDNAGLRVVDIARNDINGGSFALDITHKDNDLPANDALIEWMRKSERIAGYDTLAPLHGFNQRIDLHVHQITNLLQALKAKGKRVIGYGASTKGNVLLQYANIGPELLEAIAEINPEKYGCVTPGSHIPIISDEEARALNPDYFFVLPWHFKEDILPREQEFLRQGGRMFFPLPEPVIV
ncbi:MAG: class I SAM-dependent methyltransferase [Planctomycetota bacterium]